MGEGRRGPRERQVIGSPAGSAGFFRLGRLRSALRRPEIPEHSLASYRRERLTQLSIPVAAALMEGGFIGVIADKIFHVHPTLLALISAAPMAGNLSSALWARLAQRTRKVPLIGVLQSGLVLCVAAIALLPETRLGSGLLVSLLVLSRLLIAGLVTVRSNVWTLNYPAEVRGRVTSRLSLIAVAVMTVVSLAGSLALDADPAGFRWIYAAAALLAVNGVLSFRHVVLLGEEQRGGPTVGGVDPDVEGGRRPGILVILREDPLFARYLSWQFLLGVSNMMIEAPLLYLVSRELQASYSVSIAITVVAPLGLSVLTMPFWAAYLDSTHIARFRSRHSWLWVASLLLTWLGALWSSLLVLGLARVVLGVGRSGGMLAWQLGHNDFAHPDRAGLYMGLHASLTGLRGAFAPFLGMALYLGWSEIPLPGTSLSLPPFAGIGAGVMLLAATSSTIATLGFASLHRRIQRET